MFAERERRVPEANTGKYDSVRFIVKLTRVQYYGSHCHELSALWLVPSRDSQKRIRLLLRWISPSDMFAERDECLKRTLGNMIQLDLLLSN